MELSDLDVVSLHDEALRQWYALSEQPEVEAGDSLESVVLAQHFCNFSLWNLEDEARRIDVDDSYIANIKRAIDARNQKRNDLVERVDERLLAELEGVDVSAAERHSETAGAIIDRLSILSLKIWHMSLNARREDDAGLASECREKLKVLERQRSDLASCLRRLLEDFAAGRRFFCVYRQYKAYNDERLNPSLYKNKAGA